MSEDKPEKQPVSAIKGTHDILPKEARGWQRVEAVAKATFELYGYREIRTPVFEATELFEKSTGQTTDIVQKEMYTFTDKGGRSITLRPEYTPSVARAIIEHRLDLLPEPMRYYFIGPMFRFDKPQKPRKVQRELGFRPRRGRSGLIFKKPGRTLAVSFGSTSTSTDA